MNLKSGIWVFKYPWSALIPIPKALIHTTLIIIICVVYMYTFYPFFLCLKLEVYEYLKLRSYQKRHNMETPPVLELPAHLERKRRRRSSFYDEKTEEKELMLLKAGVRPEWLQVSRIINSKYENDFFCLLFIKGHSRSPCPQKNGHNFSLE